MGSLANRSAKVALAAKEVHDREKEKKKVRKKEARKKKREKKRRRREEAVAKDADPNVIKALESSESDPEAPRDTTKEGAPDKGKTKGKKKVTESSEESSREEEARIQAMKQAIIGEERKRFEKLTKKFKKNPQVDMTRGRCCCKYENEKGAKCVQIIDIIFLPNIIRWIFAVWAKVDDDRWVLYAKIRLVTFWIFWTLALGAIIGDAAGKVFQSDQTDASLFIDSLLILSGLMFAAIVDFHWTRVVIYHSKVVARRKEKELKAK